MENTQNKTLDFPNCPKCGSGRRLAGETLKVEVEKGKMPKQSNAFLFQHQSIIAKDMHWLSAPVIVSFFDACVECGTVYCIHAETKLAVQGGKNLPKSGNLFSPS